jgi:hypothetical protein
VSWLRTLEIHSCHRQRNERPLKHMRIFEEVFCETADKCVCVCVVFFFLNCEISRTASGWDPMAGFSDSDEELWVS